MDRPKVVPLERPKLVTQLSELPEGAHYVILTFETRTVPGDDRSRTHPGHGYPEHTEHTVSYEVWPTRAGWEAEIERRMRGVPLRAFAALVANRAKVTVRTIVEVLE